MKNEKEGKGTHTQFYFITSIVQLFHPFVEDEVILATQVPCSGFCNYLKHVRMAIHRLGIH